ncbi:MAG: hypothetical protein ACXW3L_06780, partial [Limisphaerales bacterium]
LITFSSAPGNLIHSSHTKVPTIESNLLSSGSIQASSISGTNVAAVTAGVSYLFGVRAPFSTNIPFNLQFHPKAAALGNLSGALYGGDALWSPQTNVFFSAPDALQSGLLSSNQSAFIELVIYGSGTLQFQTKIDGGGSIVVARSQMRTLTEYRGTHDWTLRTINLSGADYSVVRFTMPATNTSGGTPTAWLDDIEFTSQPPSPPSLVLFSITDAIQLLAMPVQAGRLTTIETSTNLADWLDWTNVLSSTSHYPHFRLPALPDNTPQFFRARVTP